MSKFWSTGSDSSSSDFEGERNNNEDWSESEEEVKEFEEDELSQDPNLAWDTIKSQQIFIEPLVSPNIQPPDCTRIVCMSDTHGKHREIHLPPGDILIHGGDFTKSGEPGSIKDLSAFFGESKFKEIICIAGNHDMTLHPEHYGNNWSRFHNKKFDCSESKAALKNCVYLEDEAHVTKSGIHVYGSPWSPYFYDWAFNLDRGMPIRKMWNQIPDCADVLVTHGPPLGRGDLTIGNGRAGCYDLLVAVQERIRPRVHIFGHIHEDAGVTFDGSVLYVNASNLNIKYQAVNYPVVIDVPHDVSQPARVVPPVCRIKPRDLPEWCRLNNFEKIANLLDEVDLEKLPSGNDLLGEHAFESLSSVIKMQRDGGTLKQLRNVQAKLYANSFSCK